MSKNIAIEQFYKTVSDGKLDFPELPAFLNRVYPVVGLDQTLILELIFTDVFSFNNLIQAEYCLEKVLHHPHVALKLSLAAGVDIDWEEHAEGIENWLKRHAVASSSIESNLLADGELQAIEDGKLFWHIEPASYQIVSANQTEWHQMFWQVAGLPGLKLELVSEEQEIEERREQVVAAEIKKMKKLAQEQIVVVKSPTPRSKSSGNGSSKGSPDKIWGRKINEELPLIKLNEVDFETYMIRTIGTVKDLETRSLKSGNYLVKFLLTDKKFALRCIMWAKENDVSFLEEELPGNYIEISARVEWNERFERDFQATVQGIRLAAKNDIMKQDTCEEKRVELHIHSKLSAKDACSNPKDIIMRAAQYGHNAVAITDHGVVQGFPEAAMARQNLKYDNKEIKIIYGMEGYIVDDGPTVFIAADEQQELSCTELAVIRLESEPVTRDDGKIFYKLLSFYGKKARINEDGKMGENEELSVSFSSNDSNVPGEILSASKVGLIEIANFLKNTAVISTNGLEDIHKLRSMAFLGDRKEARIKINPAFLDFDLLIELSKLQENDLSTEEKEVLACFTSVEGKNVPLTEAQMSVCFKLFERALDKTEAYSWKTLNKTLGHKDFEVLRREKAKTNHIVLLSQNDLGLYHLYRLVSLSHLDHFYSRPRIPRSKLRYFRGGLTIGAACIYGEIFFNVWQAYKVHGSDETLTRESFASEEWAKRARFYDYLEIQPLSNNQFLLTKEDSGVQSKEDLRALNRLVISLGELYNIPVCATCDSHFIDEDDGVYRDIIMSSMGFDDNEQPAPLVFRTTDEMLEEFAYLGAETAYDVVVKNTQAVAAQVEEDMIPFPNGSYPPIVEDSDKLLRDLAYDLALSQYGREGKLPPDIEGRLEKELTAVIDNGYAVMYYIAHKLVKKSNDDGYIVGSRGSVGSSVLATFVGVSEVNPLPPHYICTKCHYYEVDNSGEYGSGFDLPQKQCPDCGEALKRDGQDIPFETFLGFDGTKQPDIDLNFSGIYQPHAHAYLEEMFGTKFTFRAGTIQGYAEKQSAALVLEYCEKNGIQLGYNNAMQLSQGVQGVKVSTGQHPGGIVVVPDDREIYDFTPIQYPANKKEKGIITTHFDFNSLDETILKIDALGHDDPTMLKMLSDTTGIEILDIPIPDERVMALFQSTAAIGIPPEESTIGSATIGLPEVGTMLARSMIEETKPTRFYDLVQLSGLSHGTGVWKGNAQDLIRNGTCTINDVIGCRDSIMNTLIYAGIRDIDAFKIMEAVRKGRGLREDQTELMRKHNVPEWYIDSCLKIAYLFPKAHAAAYSISTQRVAFFKVYYPEAFYSVWFTVRGTDFSSEEHLLPPEAVKARRLEQRKNFVRMDKREEKIFYILELVEEMQARNINFLPLDIEHSHAHEFRSPEKGFVRPPLDIISGISEAMAYQITNAREKEGPFKTIDDLRRRSGLGEAAIESMREAGVLEGLPESSQVSFFELGLAGI